VLCTNEVFAIMSAFDNTRMASELLADATPENGTLKNTASQPRTFPVRAFTNQTRVTFPGRPLAVSVRQPCTSTRIIYTQTTAAEKLALRACQWYTQT